MQKCTWTENIFLCFKLEFKLTDYFFIGIYYIRFTFWLQIYEILFKVPSILKRNCRKILCSMRFSVVMAGVNGHQENLKQSVANSLSLPQIFFVPVHFRMRNWRMWLYIIQPLSAEGLYKKEWLVITTNQSKYKLKTHMRHICTHIQIFPGCKIRKNILKYQTIWIE